MCGGVEMEVGWCGRYGPQISGVEIAVDVNHAPLTFQSACMVLVHYLLVAMYGWFYALCAYARRLTGGHDRLSRRHVWAGSVSHRFTSQTLLDTRPTKSTGV